MRRVNRAEGASVCYSRAGLRSQEASGRGGSGRGLGVCEQLGIVFSRRYVCTTLRMFFVVFSLNLIAYGGVQVLQKSSQLAPAHQGLIKSSGIVAWNLLS